MTEAGGSEGAYTRWTIDGGGYRATVLAAGGGLGSLTLDGTALVAAPPERRQVTGGRGQVLLPWPNRLRDGRYTFAGTERQLPISEPAYSNATHGLVRWLVWQPLEVAPDRVRVGCRLAPQSGYPWALEVEADYRVDADGLTVSLRATNRDATPAPFAAGMHPYLDAGVRVDEVELTLAASTRELVDDRLLPVGSEPVAGEHDFRVGRRIGALELDDAYTDLDRDADGWARVQARGRHLVELHVDRAWRWVQVFTGDTLDDGARQTLAVEPMTSPADAFGSGTDLVVLEPGGRWSGTFRISRVATSGR
jgi:aldose 1-epimerase